MQSIRSKLRVAVAGLVVIGALGALTGSALAAPPPEYDHVKARFGRNGVNGIEGDVHWNSYTSGTVSLTIFNDLTDGRAVWFQQRVKQEGRNWSAWSDPVLVGTRATYPINLRTTDASRRYEYWSFRTRLAGTDTWYYDTNSPGGA